MESTQRGMIIQWSCSVFLIRHVLEIDGFVGIVQPDPHFKVGLVWVQEVFHPIADLRGDISNLRMSHPVFSSILSRRSAIDAVCDVGIPKDTKRSLDEHCVSIFESNMVMSLLEVASRPDIKNSLTEKYGNWRTEQLGFRGGDDGD
jgi:hypothetical protein